MAIFLKDPEGTLVCPRCKGTAHYQRDVSSYSTSKTGLEATRLHVEIVCATCRTVTRTFKPHDGMISH